jgi:hypothetical protein
VAKAGNGIRERSPGKYVATMYDPRVKGKTAHVGTFTAEQYGSRAAARKAAEDAKKEAERQRDLQLKSPVGGETIGSFAERWPRDYTEKRDEPTQRHNMERVKALIRDFGDRPLRGGISGVEARAWAQGGIVPVEIRDVARRWYHAEVLPDGDVKIPGHMGNVTAVRAMFNDAGATWPGEIVNPFAKLGLSKSRGRSDIVVINEAELALLVETAFEIHGGAYGEHFGALIESAAWDGLRPGEQWAIDLSGRSRVNLLDFEKGEINVKWQIDTKTRKTRRPKWGSVRTVFMLPPAEAALRRAIDCLPEHARDGALWRTKRDMSPMTARTLGYYWSPVRAAFWQKLPEWRREEIPSHFDFYELRHFFGTQLAEMNMHPTEIADQMGHKDGGKLAMERYIHPRKEQVQRSMLERFAEYERRKAIGQ